MYCSKCGHSVKDRDQFCPNCGAPNPRAEAGAQSAMNPTQVQPVYPPPKREKSNHSLTLVIIAIVAAAAIVFAALYFVLTRPRSRLSSEKTTKVTVNNYDSDGNKTSGTASDSRSAANRSNHQSATAKSSPLRQVPASRPAISRACPPKPLTTPATKYMPATAASLIPANCKAISTTKAGTTAPPSPAILTKTLCPASKNTTCSCSNPVKMPSAATKSIRSRQ